LFPGHLLFLARGHASVSIDRRSGWHSPLDHLEEGDSELDGRSRDHSGRMRRACGLRVLVGTSGNFSLLDGAVLSSDSHLLGPLRASVDPRICILWDAEIPECRDLAIRRESTEVKLHWLQGRMSIRISLAISVVLVVVGYLLMMTFCVDWVPSARPYSVRFQNGMIGLGNAVLWASTILSSITAYRASRIQRTIGIILVLIGILPFLIEWYLLAS